MAEAEAPRIESHALRADAKTDLDCAHVARLDDHVGERQHRGGGQATFELLELKSGVLGDIFSAGAAPTFLGPAGRQAAMEETHVARSFQR